MKRFILILAGVLLLISPCFAIQGDFDNSSKVGLQDAVLGLQVTAGLRNASTLSYIGNIGLAEVIYDLRVLAGIAPDSDITNTLNMTFKLIPAGIFMMGSLPDEPGLSPNEVHQHQVTLTNSFYMQITEVTQGQWKAVMDSNPSYFSTCGDNCPVERLSWDDAQSFITKMNQRGEGAYRLPTEAEWEYAARGGTSTWFAFGNCLSSDQANYDGRCPLPGCASGQYRAKTLPVMSFAPNAFGLYDMHGNVWEWVQDWYSYHTASAVTNPTGPSSGSFRVIRGGGWYNYAQNCRSAERSNNSPGSIYYGVGFRLVHEQ
ncbi:MAG: formylglycine-generating enzyme family protein [Desulfobacteraceae bacterium]|nr:formylglycine-generating enzyme family protein [Desulfobacteraceae bacterium]